MSGLIFTGVFGDQPRRLAVLNTSPEFLVEFCKSGFGAFAVDVVKNALPEDTKYVCCRTVFDGETVSVVVESETFGLVAPGDVLPVLGSPTFRRLQGC